MNSNIAYSASLKRMLGYKMFININPEEIKIENSIDKNKALLKDNEERTKSHK
jgi:hypothetical protein